MKHAQLASNIQALRKSLGLNQTQFAERVESLQPSVSKWEKGALPEAVPLSNMAALAGVTVAEFMRQPWVPAIQEPDLPPTRLLSAGEDTVEIAVLDLSFSMGSGTAIDDYIEETPLRFDQAYIRGFTRTVPHRLRIARGIGESMFPTLASSDQIWIDTTQTVLSQQDRIWAISLFGAAAIKRLRAIGDGKILVISDNPAVENQVVAAEDLLIGGRVIRFAREI